jgi:hypothetical protein
MARAIITVSTEPVSSDRLAEFHEWYDSVHIPEILATIDGITSAQRFRVSPSGPAHPDQSYLAIYQVDADDPEQVLRALRQAAANQVLTRSDAVSRTPAPTVTLYHSL